ncbi:MAG: hypothetical protein IJ538_01680 [Clostridia bacterium]|nr:hypothetical protein [Clostridia bacterium]
MFEILLSVPSFEQKQLSKYSKNIVSSVKASGGIALLHNHSKRSFLAIAVSEKEKEFFKALISDMIVNFVIEVYKYNFFKEKFYVNENEITEAFLNAISIFDSDADKEIIKGEIEFGDEILIDSFYFFKLTGLQSKWRKTIEIISQNQIQNNKFTMIEVIKYLTETSDNNVSVAKVSLNEKNIKLENFEEKRQFKRTINGRSKFFSELIKLNPARITITLDSEDGEDDVLPLLNQIFDDKIYVLN